MHVNGKGQLRHCFWGTYYGTIAIAFKDEQSAKDARKVLGESWKHSEKTKSALVFHGKDPELDSVLDKLESFGAPRKLVTSCAKSIDFGEPFEVTIPVQPIG